MTEPSEIRRMVIEDDELMIEERYIHDKSGRRKTLTRERYKYILNPRLLATIFTVSTL